jgi:3-hydroxyisobutyrate dehydrogenase-like beta-hydroxyacid dehydrogenase
MGLGMALNLQKHLQVNGLPPLRYSNRTLSKGQPLQDAGAIPETGFQEVVQNSDLIFTMVREYLSFGQTHSTNMTL